MCPVKRADLLNYLRLEICDRQLPITPLNLLPDNVRRQLVGTIAIGQCRTNPLGVGKQLFDVTLHEHAAAVEKADRIRNALDIIQRVSGKQDCMAPVADGAQHAVKKLLASDRVQPRHRLIEHQHLRFVRHRQY